MRTIKKAFRFERLGEIPSVLKAGGCRLVNRAIDLGSIVFECRSAGGVAVRFWVTPKTPSGPAMFCAGIEPGPFQRAIQFEPVTKVLALLEIRGCLLAEGDETKS